MTHPNKICCGAMRTAMLALAMSSAAPLTAHANADQFDITFKANIRETTCDMTINGSSNSAIIDIGNVTLGEIITHKDDNSSTGPNMATFTLEMKECPQSLTGIKTTISGSYSGYDTTGTILISSQSGDATPTGIGARISRTSAPTSYFKIFDSSTSTSDNGSEVIKWEGDELTAGKVNLVARLVPTQSDASSAVTGNFRATATFNFSYE
ncbi:fimbrial protein [Salmonella enterica]|uniref:fimbrial protein n=1 Tax=Salmonella enterica TaxID=28901 RepID=UPI001013AD6C|nr:fimbrial protein [Salmonella enterica]RXO39124.1 fimbrial protein [Salmonella enterica]